MIVSGYHQLEGYVFEIILKYLVQVTLV